MSESGLESRQRKSFEITIRWYLSFCKRSRVRATKRTAREFIEMAREEKGATEAVLESWREGIRWFFREGRAEMRREDSLGRRGRRPSQKERDIVRDVSVPSVEAGLKGEEFEPKKPRGGWRAAMIRVLRIRKYAYRTEQSYLHWANRFARTQERRGRMVEEGEVVQAGDAPCVAPFVCHAFVGVGDGYPNGSGFAGAQGCFDDADLHACHGQAGDGSEESAGFVRGG